MAQETPDTGVPPHEARRRADTGAVYSQFSIRTRVRRVIVGGKTVSHTYDAAGNRTTVTDPKPATWTYTFNAHNEQKQLTQPDNRTEQLYYDPAGNRTKKIDGNNAQILYEYDALDRLTKVDYPTGTDTAFTYDAMGRRLTMADSTGTTTYGYDAAGRLTGTT